jgi:hypothetical protein
MESLKQRGSWLYEATQNVIGTNPKFMEAAVNKPRKKTCSKRENH